VKEVDIFKEEDLVEHFKNTDAVVSCLGCRPSFLGWSTITFYLDTIKPIVAAMRTANKKRLVCISAWGTVCKYIYYFVIKIQTFSLLSIIWSWFVGREYVCHFWREYVLSILESTCIISLRWEFSIATFYWCACTKPGILAVLYLCVMSIDFSSFYDFSIRFWKCSNIVVFSVFHFIYNNVKVAYIYNTCALSKHIGFAESFPAFRAEYTYLPIYMFRQCTCIVFILQS